MIERFVRPLGRTLARRPDELNNPSVLKQTNRQPAPEGRLLASQRGFTLVEYALILTVLVALVVFVIAVAVLAGA